MQQLLGLTPLLRQGATPLSLDHLNLIKCSTWHSKLLCQECYGDVVHFFKLEIPITVPPLLEGGTVTSLQH